MTDIEIPKVNDMLALEVPSYHNVVSQCSYHTLPIDASQIGNGFSVLHLNARSVRNKFDDIQNFISLSGVKWSVVCISETWLKSDEIESYALDDYNTIASCRNSGVGGGSLLYVSKKLKIKERKDLESNLIETSFVEVSICQSTRIIIGNIYRPPNFSHLSFYDYLEKMLDTLEKEKKTVILGGDFNYNLLELNREQQVLNFCNLLSSYGFSYTITRPTRTQNGKHSLLDNFFVNDLSIIKKSGVVIEDLSDHLPVFVSLTVEELNNKSVSKIKKIFDKVKSPLLRQYLSSTLHNFKRHTDANEACKELIDSYTKGIDKYSKTFKSSSRKTALKPWISPALLCSINKKNNLYRKLLRKPNKENNENYKQFRNILTRLLRDAKKRYYELTFEENRNDSRKTWNTLNEIISKRKKQTNDLPSSFTDSCGGRILEGPEVAQGFNDFFSTIGSQLEEEIASPDCSPLSFLKRPTHKEFSTPMSTNQNEVEIIIKSLNHVGGGIDNISTEVLLLTYQVILDHLTFFFNLCLSTAVFPDQLKIAIIKPIYKSGNRHIFNNYRPISLLPIFSKILEKIIYSRLTQYTMENNLIDSFQFGFRTGHSTYMPIAHLTNEITSSLQNHYITCVLYLDLKKAFDTVSITILLDKLKHLGITGKMHQLLQSYLSNRKQKTQVHSYVSEEASIKMGVPQGSILGPLLFILYINDIVNISDKANFYLFADDTAISIRAHRLRDLKLKILSVLQLVTKWFCSNRLSLNASKTFYQIFSRQFVQNLNININNQVIARKESVKYLGVLIDENLKWQSHIDSIALIISRNIGIMGRAKYILSSHHLFLLYNILVLPYLNYCAAVWGSNYASRTSKLVKLQKRAIRIIDKKPYAYHTRELFIQYKILRFPDLVKKQQIIILLGYLNETLPRPIFEMFQYQLPSSTRAAQHFKIPRALSNYKAFSLSVSAPRTWNAIVGKIYNNIDDVPRNKNTLKKHITEFLLSQY